MVFFRKMSVVMALFISVASLASERDIGMNIDDVMQNDAAFQQAYEEHNVQQLGLTEAEFKQKFKQFYDLGNDPALSEAAHKANESLRKVADETTPTTELKTQALRDLNILKSEQANRLGINVTNIDAFRSAAARVLVLSQKKNEKIKKEAPITTFETDPSEYIQIVCNVSCMGDLNGLYGSAFLGQLAQAAGANCSFFTCDQVYVHWQVHGSGNGSVYQYYSNMGGTPMMEWVSGPKVNSNGQLDYEP